MSVTSESSLRAGFSPVPITLESAAVQIADQLRGAIADARLKPGDRLLPEQQLAQTFRVSRGTVREAIRLLTAENLLTSTRGAGGGTFVILPDSDTVARQLGYLLSLWFRVGDVSLGEVTHARRVLEFECVRLAALNRTDADLALVRQPVEESRDASVDIDEWLAMDIEFHSAVSRSARNKVLDLAMTAVHLVRPLTNTLLLHTVERQPVIDQHWAMFEAIRDRDPERAVEAFARHNAYLDGVVAAALAERDALTLSVANIPLEPHPPASVLLRHQIGHPLGT